MKTNTPRTDAEFYDGLLWRIKNQLPPNWTPEDAGIWMANFARTLELELRTARHELSMITEDVEAYRTDCSTPVFQMVRNMKEERDQLRALLSTQSEMQGNQAKIIQELRAEVKESDRDRVRLAALVSTERYTTQQWRAVAEQAVEAMKSMRPLEMGKAVTAYEKLKGQP